MVMERHATVNGRATRYLEAGKGRPLILLHAFPLSAGMWQSQIDHVPDGWRFIAPDLRGFGAGTPDANVSPNKDANASPNKDANASPNKDANASPNKDAYASPNKDANASPNKDANASPNKDANASPNKDANASPNMDEYAGDIIALMDALGIETAVIGGLSMGGYVTFALFRQAPKRFDGVILADTKAQADTPEGQAGRRAMSEMLRTKGVSAVVDELLPRLVGETTHRERPEVLVDARRLMEANQPDAIHAALHALMTRPDSTPDLHRISCPALVIVGQEDVVTPAADAELLACSIPRAELVVLPRVGHLSNLEAPEGFSSALTRFLSRAF